MTRIALLAVLVALLPATAWGQFSRNTTDIPSGSPNNSSSTENVDFADVDLDGDWDAVFADGGDFGNDQDRIWINMGGLQGGTLGVFVDQTNARLPQVLQTGRDIEFVDLDRDGDFDIYTSNTSQQNNQSNRWWINMGGLQGGTPGFYSDETSTRWIGIAQPGSSVPTILALPSGGFIDWSCDCDFGDLDNDGDLDLLHSTYGGEFGGQVPTRLFLNDGTGKYKEFNPSGFQLTFTEIADGDPAIWSEGIHMSDTLVADGTQADVASQALDIEVGDVDGDLDLDLLHGARAEKPRMFYNRLEETGSLAFRDVTGAVFVANYSTGGGHYAQELGDLDEDDDLDIYGLNWKATLNDITLENVNDFFTNQVQLTASGSDDNEGDFIDYDGDGDLDLFVANFGGQEKLYRNDSAGAGIVMPITSGLVPSDTTRTLDADMCDVDGDGMYDLFVANDNFQADWYLHNDGNQADTTPARLAHLEQALDRAPSPAPTVVRVHVYDNAAYYINWYNTTLLEYQVNGGSFTALPMQSSMGQVFRGEIPGQLTGTICYRVRTSDEFGNTTLSNTKCYTSGGCTGNVVTYCTAKTNSCGTSPAIGASGVPSASLASGFVVTGSNTRQAKSGLIMYSPNGRGAAAFQGGILCINPMGLRRSVTTVSAGGSGGAVCDATLSLDWNGFASGVGGGNPAAFLHTPGQQVNLQWWARDTLANGSYLSNGLEYFVCP